MLPLVANLVVDLHAFPFVTLIDVANNPLWLLFHVELDRSAAALTLLAVARGDLADAGAGFSLGLGHAANQTADFAAYLYSGNGLDTARSARSCLYLGSGIE